MSDYQTWLMEEISGQNNRIDDLLIELMCAPYDKVRASASIAAMQGMLSNPELLEVVTSKEYVCEESCAARVATVAVRYADALIDKLGIPKHSYMDFNCPAHNRLHGDNGDE